MNYPHEQGWKELRKWNERKRKEARKLARMLKRITPRDYNSDDILEFDGVLRNDLLAKLRG